MTATCIWRPVMGIGQSRSSWPFVRKHNLVCYYYEPLINWLFSFVKTSFLVLSVHQNHISARLVVIRSLQIIRNKKSCVEKKSTEVAPSCSVHMPRPPWHGPAGSAEQSGGTGVHRSEALTGEIGGGTSWRGRGRDFLTGGGGDHLGAASVTRPSAPRRRGESD